MWNMKNVFFHEKYDTAGVLWWWKDLGVMRISSLKSPASLSRYVRPKVTSWYVVYRAKLLARYGFQCAEGHRAINALKGDVLIWKQEGVMSKRGVAVRSCRSYVGGSFV